MKVEWRHRLLFGAVVFALITSCDKQSNAANNDVSPPHLHTQNTEAENNIRQFVAAYNAKDLDRMMTLAHDDITWLSIDGEQTSVMTAGAPAMRQELSQYLAPDATPHSAVEILKSHGNFVTTIERAYWTVNGEEKSQSSFAVYEMQNKKIRRVWYFPASE